MKFVNFISRSIFEVIQIDALLVSLARLVVNNSTKFQRLIEALKFSNYANFQNSKAYFCGASLESMTDISLKLRFRDPDSSRSDSATEL